jgi:hypothetical protein
MPRPSAWRRTATEEESMATVRVDPRSLPDPNDERVIRRIIRLTICTLAGMLVALICLPALVNGPATSSYAQSVPQEIRTPLLP